MEVGHIPPHDLDAEQAILGSMLVDRDAAIAAIEVLKGPEFYREDHKAIYESMLGLYNKSEPIDLITVKSELSSMGRFEQIGGLAYLSDLPGKVPTTANTIKYVNIVKEKYVLRSLIKTANEIIEESYDTTLEVESVLEDAEKKVFDLLQDKEQKGYSEIKDVLVDSFNLLEELCNQKGNVTGIPTHFYDFDHKTAGLHGSDLIILAARPAMGKTAFALNLAANAAIKSKTGVAVFSLEMSKAQLANRILCCEAMVDSNKVRTGNLDENDWMKLANSIGPISDSNIYIDDTAGISITEIRAKARKLKLEKDIGLIIVDYLQLIQGTGKKGSSREQEISEISRMLKMLAKELDIPVIALSQLSRAVESRPDKRPMLSDLRESGAIEQDADIILFLYRDDYYNQDSEKKDIAELILAKHRGGSLGTVELLWLRKLYKICQLRKKI